MTRRFVVQRHTRAPGDVHYDLMVEDAEVLVTFQLEEAPANGASGVRSFDHRRRYLEFEGELSEGRGQVEIWDQGELSDIQGGPRDTTYRARFEGERLAGLYELCQQAEQVTLKQVVEE